MVNKLWALGQMQPITYFSMTLPVKNGFCIFELLKKNFKDKYFVK